MRNTKRHDKMKCNTSYHVILLTSLLALGCNDFLDEPQDNRTVIDNREKVGQLLASAYTNAQYAEFAEAMSDNAADRGPDAFDQSDINEKAYRWEDHSSAVGAETVTNFWTESYTAIAHANQALVSIDELGGGDELNQYKGEALVARAYVHFMLVNFFSVRYDPATAEEALGVPYVLDPEVNAIKTYKRETVAEVYRLIEKDLTAGTALVGDQYEEAKFHFTSAAARAFATRFYLYKGDWQAVVANANEVLVGDPALLIRDWVSPTFMSLTYDQRLDSYSASRERANLLISWVNSVYARKFASVRYALTDDVTDTLFNDGVGNPFGKNWGYLVFGTTPLFRNIPKYDEYFRVINVSQGIGFAFASVVHFTTDEVLLNRAEAYVMLNQVAAAESDLSAFLSQKTRGYDPTSDSLEIDVIRMIFPNAREEYSPFYDLSDDQATFVKAIAEFRRREFCHEGLRWLDIKRFKLVVERVFEIGGPRLERDDPRRVIQIPESARAFGIKANPR